MVNPNAAPGFLGPAAADHDARVPNRMLPDLAATWALGEELAQQLPPGAVLLLCGDLGAGKTTLVQGLAKGLGIPETVTSPSFALAHHYTGRRANGTPTALVHLDLYRIDHPAAADELFAQEMEEALFLGAVMVVEWPERLGARPSPAWAITLTYADPGDPLAGRVAMGLTVGTANGGKQTEGIQQESRQ
jgi:tRNA threonylcarbamoyladenosine biosynthesis protein TsaE